MVQVNLKQISGYIKTHAIWVKHCFLVDMNSEHFRVHLCVGLYALFELFNRVYWGVSSVQLNNLVFNFYELFLRASRPTAKINGE